MPHCESCGSGDINKENLKFDEARQQVVCTTCNPPAPEVAAPTEPKLRYGIHFTNTEGLKAELSFGDIGLALSYNNDQLRQLFGRHG